VLMANEGFNSPITKHDVGNHFNVKTFAEGINS
jgi:hypothetical protein